VDGVVNSPPNTANISSNPYTIAGIAYSIGYHVSLKQNGNKTINIKKVIN